MKKGIMPFFAGMVFFTFMVFGGCGKSSNNNEKDKKDNEVAVPVEYSQVTQGDIAAFFSSTATLESEEETEVVAKVGGVVKKILVEEGDYVNTEQVLAKLDDEKLMVQLDQTSANMQKLEQNYKRSEELFKKNLISTEEFQQSKYEYEYQKAAYDLAKLDLDYTSIRTPIEGVISQRLIKVGNMVLPNEAVYSVTGMNPLLAILHIPERNINKLKVGHASALSVDAIKDKIFHGRIKRISPVVDPMTGTVKVTVEVYDRSMQLKPGMFARVHITYDTHQNTLLVPKDAVIEEDKASSLFVVQDSMVFRKHIKLGYINTSHVEIIDGINLGDTVVTTGKGSLKDSTRVELVE